MPEFQTVGKVTEIPEGQAKAYSVKNKTIAVFHQPGGQFLAIDDYCPHMGAPLSEGIVEDGKVHCPWHGWQFRLNDGTWVNSPKLKIGCFAVRVVGDDLQIEV